LCPCVEALTRDVVGVLDLESIPKVCVVGHSYGSFIASKLNMAYR
jgi:pimeloyl-ACP methyl ester carboxylesterase